MTTRVSLSEMLDMLRAEARISMNVAHGQASRDAHVNLLNRVQAQLANDHDWPDMKVTRDVVVEAGDGTYALPTDIDYGYANAVWCSVGALWVPVVQGIEPSDTSGYPSTFRAWPITRWAISGENGAENLFDVWPVPNQSGTLRFRGRRRVAKLVDATDLSTLDGTLIVLFAAAEILAGQKAEDAQFKLQTAQGYYRKLKSRLSTSRHGVLVVGGGFSGRGAAGRPGIDYVPMGYGKDGRGG